MGSKVIKKEEGTWKHPLQMCRLCLSDESVEDVFKIDHLQQWISDFLSIKISNTDRMSRVICTICRIRMDEFYQFRVRCLDVQSTMKKMIEDAERFSEPIVKDTTFLSVDSITDIQSIEMEGLKNQGFNETDDPLKDINEKDIKPFVEFDTENEVQISTEESIPRVVTISESKESNSQNSNQDENASNANVESQEEENSERSYDDEGMEDDQIELDDDIEVEEIKVETREDDYEETSDVVSKNQCNVCRRVYKTGKGLHRHKKFVHGPKNHKCHICNMAYTLRSALTRHEYTSAHLNKLKEKLKHQRNITPTTNQIPKSKKSKLRLQVSNQKKKESIAATDGDKGNAYACTKCSRTFNRQCQLENHMKYHEKGGEERTIDIEDEEFIVDGTKAIPPDLKLPCDICQKVFSDKFKLYNHKRIHGKKRFHCPICERPFINGFLMRKHVETHKPLAERQKLMPPVKEQNKVLQTFSCDLCPKTYNRQRSLMNHKKSIHEPKTHECEICGYKFPFRDNLTAHMKVHIFRRHTKEDFEPLRMMRQKAAATVSEDKKGEEKANNESDDDSDDSSSQSATKPQKTGLISNLLMEKSDEQSFQCNVCQKSFEDYSRLRSHKRIVHKARKHKCPLCERTYPYRKPLLVHMESHKSESGPAEEFECGECHKIYPSFKALHYHVSNGHVRKKAIESSNTSFDCPKCDKSFPTMAQTKLHMRTIHSSKENRCHICNQTFTIYVQLWQHIKIYHGTKDVSKDETKDSTRDVDSNQSSEIPAGSKAKQTEKSVGNEIAKTATRRQPRRSAKLSSGENFAEYFDSSDDSSVSMSEKRTNFRVCDVIDFGGPSTLVVLDHLLENRALESSARFERNWQRTDGFLEWNLDVVFQLNRCDDEVLLWFDVTVDEAGQYVGISKLRGGHVLDVEVVAQKRQGPTLKAVGRVNRNTLLLFEYPQKWLMIRLEGELASEQHPMEFRYGKHQCKTFLLDLSVICLRGGLKALKQCVEHLVVLLFGFAGHEDVVQKRVHSFEIGNHAVHQLQEGPGSGFYSWCEPVEAEETSMRVDCEQMLRVVVNFHLKIGVTQVDDAEIPAPIELGKGVIRDRFVNIFLADGRKNDLVFKLKFSRTENLAAASVLVTTWRSTSSQNNKCCDVCFKMYPTDKVLHRHKKIVHGPKNHKCLICNKAYTLRSVLTIHEYSIAHLTKLKERLKHQRNLPVTTNQIPKSKKAKLRLQAQKLKESEANGVQSIISTKGDGDGNGYACTKCSRIFKRQCQLDNHMKTHEKREEEQTIGIEDEDYIVDGTKAIPPDVDLKLPCDVCHKVFADKYKLYGHKKIHGKKRFHCPICERPFINGFLMKKHVETHKPLAERQKLMPPVKEQNEILETFSCDLCPKTYNRKRALMTHKKSKHEPKTHECEICGYKFPFRDNLTKHMRTHVLRRQTREDFEPIRMMQQKTTNAAPDVEKEAAQADSESNDDSDNSSSQPATTPKRTGLISALLMKKSDEQSFQCNVCQKSFEDYARLRSHKRIVHKARKHKCPQCERTYPYRKAMLIHMESHKSKDGPAEEFECGECHKIYSTFKALHCHVANKHIKKKAYENPNLSFDCSKCDRSFPTITQMKSHDRMVHPTKEYRCHICNQNFRIYVQLWQHMKHSHGTILKEFGAGDNCTPEDTDRTAKGSKDSDGDDNSERSFESSYSSKDKQAEKSKSQSATRAQPRRSVKSSTVDNFAEYFDSADSL
ncbi:uncharacterized protein LOC134210337 [Armigeres subalbatus]|uniref:uncharacterized protein LOC134210337 n=1 Tax=Armigeres subalbatus TaxID=124917 RepID=UPI002ED403CF